MKILSIISRFITGILFTFSGFVKSVDPIGTQIKFEDYFEAMGLDFLMPYALFFSFLLNSAEFVIGLMLILNLFPKFTAWSALLFLALFTPLTFWLALANPVTDCGCFGDAITLTNWQTFWKNIVLLIFVIIIFVYRKKIKLNLPVKLSFILTGVISVIILYFQFYNFSNLPIIDFRPFKEGINIKENSIIPEGAQKAVYEIALFYKNKKSGEVKKFSLEDIPEDESIWGWESTADVLITKGYEPPIHDFFLTGLNGEDLTDSILNNEKISYLLIMHKFEKGIKLLDSNIISVAQYAEKNNIKFYCLTASGSDEINKYKRDLPDNIEICTADYKMLKTFIRANTGFVKLENAVIKEKQNYKNIDLNDFKD